MLGSRYRFFVRDTMEEEMVRAHHASLLEAVA